jgi:hypothetical protein
MDRKKLDTLIEKEAYQLVSNIKNHTESFVQLAVRRKNLKVDQALVDTLVTVIGTAMEDGFQTQVDLFNRGIEKALDQYTAEENPTRPTSSKKATK